MLWIIISIVCGIYYILVRYVAQSQQLTGIWLILAVLFFVLFLSGLAALTLFPAKFWPYVVDFIASGTPLAHFEWGKFYPTFTGWDDLNLQLELFREIKRAFKGPWVFFIMLGNIGIFVPIGFFTALLWRKPRWWRSLLAGFGCSCFIELVQPYIGRCGDVDDILLNTAGALLGYILYRLLHLICGTYLDHFQCCTKGEHAPWMN